LVLNKPFFDVTVTKAWQQQMLKASGKKRQRKAALLLSGQIMIYFRLRLSPANTEPIGSSVQPICHFPEYVS